MDVGENDIVKINIGDSADVEVDAYNNRKFKGIVTKIASSTKSTSLASTNDVTNYEVRIRLDKESYKDLGNRTFPFRPGMNASADIKTRRVDNVLAVPISAVNARVKGSDQSMADKKKEKEDSKGKKGMMFQLLLKGMNWKKWLLYCKKMELLKNSSKIRNTGYQLY